MAWLCKVAQSFFQGPNQLICYSPVSVRQNRPNTINEYRAKFLRENSSFLNSPTTCLAPKNFDASAAFALQKIEHKTRWNFIK